MFLSLEACILSSLSVTELLSSCLFVKDVGEKNHLFNAFS